MAAPLQPSAEACHAEVATAIVLQDFQVLKTNGLCCLGNKLCIRNPKDMDFLERFSKRPTLPHSEVDGA